MTFSKVEPLDLFVVLVLFKNPVLPGQFDLPITPQTSANARFKARHGVSLQLHTLAQN